MTNDRLAAAAAKTPLSILTQEVDAERRSQRLTPAEKKRITSDERFTKQMRFIITKIITHAKHLNPCVVLKIL